MTYCDTVSIHICPHSKLTTPCGRRRNCPSHPPPAQCDQFKWKLNSSIFKCPTHECNQLRIRFRPGIANFRKLLTWTFFGESGACASPVLRPSMSLLWLSSVWPGHKWHKPCCNRSIWAIWVQSTLMDFDFVQSTRAICINLFHHFSSLLRSLRRHPQGHWKPKPNPAQLALRCFQGARNPQAGARQLSEYKGLH